MSEIDRLYRYKTLLSHRRTLPREDILAAFETLAKATFERKQLRVRHHNRLSSQTLERIQSPQQLIH